MHVYSPKMQYNRSSLLARTQSGLHRSNEDLQVALPYKATPSDTLVSGPEVFLITCGRAVFLIMSLSISPYESHYFANNEIESKN